MKFILDCISDTHTKHDYLDFQAPVMDPEDVWILVHAGDFTHQGTAEQVTIRVQMPLKLLTVVLRLLAELPAGEQVTAIFF